MSKKKRPRRNIPPATLLRPRMEDLFRDDTLLPKEDAAIQEALRALTQGVSDRLFVKTLLRAYAAASEAVQARLDAILPGWLAAHDDVEVLQMLAEERSLGPDLRPSPWPGWMPPGPTPPSWRAFLISSSTLTTTMTKRW
jgi:hypothetical protein